MTPGMRAWRTGIATVAVVVIVLVGWSFALKMLHP